MKLIGRITLGLVAVLLLLAVIVGVRTAAYKPPSGADLSQVKLAAPVAVDTSQAAQHLSQAVQIQTVSHQDKAENQYGEWDRLHAWLQATYPASTCSPERTSWRTTTTSKGAFSVACGGSWGFSLLCPPNSG